MKTTRIILTGKLEQNQPNWNSIEIIQTINLYSYPMIFNNPKYYHLILCLVFSDIYSSLSSTALTNKKLCFSFKKLLSKLYCNNMKYLLKWCHINFNPAVANIARGLPTTIFFFI